MTDIQFMHLRDGSNSFHVVIGQTVTSVNFQTETSGKGRGFGDTRQLLRLFGVSFGISIATGVDLDKQCANLCRSFDLLFIGVDKQRNLDPGLRQTFTGIAHFVTLPCDVQAAFGCYFLTLFRYQTAKMWLRLNGDRQHLFGHRHLQIHAGIQRLTQDAHIAVGNVAAIFT